MSDDAGSGSPRQPMTAVGGTGLLAATAAEQPRPVARGRRGPADGTPEQVHLTWGDDPARSVVVSWASPGRAVAPRVRIGQRIITATEGGYHDGRSGEATWTYHARVAGLRPGATYGYAVTADNDHGAPDPFSATFTTAPEGRAAFRFTSFGDLAAPNPRWAGSLGQAAYAVGAVETFQPLFHLLNGDLSDADLNPATQPQLWRDFGNNLTASAAYRPWMPVPGHHECGPGDGEQGLASYLARYSLPANGLPAFEGRWYSFRVGTVAFFCLSGEDQGGAQARWLEATLAEARRNSSIDWIVVQLHQCACSSAAVSDGGGDDDGGDDDGGDGGGGGSDLGVRREWLSVFDRYEVDLVLCGHDHGYERSFPVRGYEASPDVADARRPHPVTTVDSGVFDTSQGTVHLVLGCGSDPHPAARATAGAAWSARRDTTTGYGIAVFDVNPGTEAGGQTSITVRYYHAVGADPAAGTPAGDYTIFETFTLVRPRSDGRRWHAK